MLIFTMQVLSLKETVLEIIFEEGNGLLYFLACVFIAAIITLLVYFKNKETRELTTIQRSLLYFLRFSGLLFLLVLLISPFIKTTKKNIEPPIIITAFDNSMSMLPTEKEEEIRADLNAIYDKLNSGFAQNYTTINYTFGESANRDKELTFQEKHSDYADLINQVYNTHFNDNIGAMVLIGDGIYNHGNNPVNAIEKLNFPIYTIGVGDTVELVDSRILAIYSNKTAFLDNQFPVEVDVSMQKAQNQQFYVRIVHNGEIISSQKINPNSNDFFKTIQFLLPANEKGLQHYRVELESNIIEQNNSNNSAQFVINVLENKQKILLISDGAHPDLGAINNTLLMQQNYEVSMFSRAPYPENVGDFNLVIFHQLPGTGFTGTELLDICKQKKIPVLFLLGAKSYIPQLNKLDLGLEIITQPGNNEDAKAVFNTDYQLFSLSDRFKDNLAKFPPLQAAFGDYQTKAGFQTIFYQNINGIETDRPLLVTTNNSAWKRGFLLGEGLWRWRMYDYYLNENHQNFNEFVTSLVQYLALKDNEDNFIINYEPTYNETDPVIIHAEVYNEAFEPINELDVTISIKDSMGNDFQYTFDKYKQGYRLNAGMMPIGDYSFEATVNISEQEYKEQGRFVVVPVNIESTINRADHNLLYRLSANTNGELYFPQNIDELINSIKQNPTIKPAVYEQTSFSNVLNLKWLFALILLVFSLEWFLRKFWGIY